MDNKEAIETLEILEKIGNEYRSFREEEICALDMAIKALEQPQFYPPCEDCNKKMDEIRKAYDRCKEQQPCTDAISLSAALKKWDELSVRGRTEFDQALMMLPPVSVCADAITIDNVIDWLKNKDIIKLSTQDEMARKELRELPSVNICTDAISRQAVLVVYTKLYDKIDTNQYAIVRKELYEIYKEIENLPSVSVAKKVGRWIPVSERFPKEDEIVIVSITDDSGDSEYRYTSCAWYYDGIWVIDNERISSSFVKAWMPLPTPYEPQESEDDCENDKD